MQAEYYHTTGRSWLFSPLDWMYSNVSFHVLCAYYSELDTGWSAKQYTTYYNRLYFAKDGCGTLAVNGIEVTIQPGRVYLIPSGSILDVRTESFLKLHWAHFITQTDQDNDLFETLQTPLTIDDETPQATQELFLKMESSMMEPLTGWRNLQRTSWLLKLLVPFLKAAEQHPHKSAQDQYLPVI